MKKLTEKNLIRKAEKLREKIEALQKEAQALAHEIACYGEVVDYDTYIYELREVEIEAEEFGYKTFLEGIPNY